MTAAEFWARWRESEVGTCSWCGLPGPDHPYATCFELTEDGGRRIIRASELEFVERVPHEAGGPPRRRGHYYAWGRCSRCGELRLTERAGITKKKCAMTPGCKGRLEPAEDAQDFTNEEALWRAVRAFDAEVVEVMER